MLSSGAAPPPATCATSKVTVGDAQLLAGCWTAKGDLSTASGRVRLNGLDIVPSAGITTIDRKRARLITGGPAEVRLGRLLLYRGSLDWEIGRQIAFSITSSGKTVPAEFSDSTIGGLRVKGSVGLTFSAGKLTGTVSVALPGALANVTADVGVAADNERGLILDTLKAVLDGAQVGPAEVRDGSLTYSRAGGGRWEGGATFYPSKVQALSIQGVLRFGAGGYFKLGGGVDGLNRPLLAGVFFQKAVAELTVNPFSLLGGLGVTYGPQFKLAGMAPISAARLDGSFRYEDADPAVFELKGTGKVAVADFDGGLSFTSAGAVDTEGTATLTVPGFDQYGLNASVKGWYERSAFEVLGAATIALPGPDASGEAVLSSVGVAACRRGAGPDFGYGFRYDGGLEVMNKSCGLGPFRPQRARARAAGASGGKFEVPAGRKTVTFAVSGIGGPPHVLLSGPGGVRVDTPTDPTRAVDTPKAYAFVDLQTATTYIAIDRPRAGTYSIQPQPGSASVRSYESAESRAAVTVRATARRAVGGRRVLRYRARGLAGGRLRFVEEGRGVRTVLATTRRPAGSVRFVPATGPGGTRTVRVLVEQDGLQQPSRRVARYTTRASRVSPVRRVRVVRGRAQLRASWTGPGKATYRVRLRLDNGRRVLRRVVGRHVRFPAVPRMSRARIEVRRVDASGQFSAAVVRASAGVRTR